MGCKAYVSAGLTLGDARVGTAFKEAALTVVNAESDRVGIDTLLKMTDSAAAGGGSTSAGDSIDSVETTVKRLLRTLEGVTDFVEKVVQGKATADPAVVCLLQQLVAAAPRLPSESFGKMVNTQVQDMLTIVYLANLTRTQLALAEKLQAVTLNATATER
jgi:translation initiation factor 3 subunit F